MEKVKCIASFCSIDGNVIFNKGKLYHINQFGVIDSGKNYFLHWTNDLTEYFTKM